MRRAILLATLIAAGSLSLAVSGFQAPPPAGPTPAALQATRIEKVKDNLYIITGSSPTPRDAFSGGNTAVFITANGVVVIDTKLAGWGQVILDRIKTVTVKPVTTIINTHTHGDHTGSNEFFGTTVEIVAQENTKANMEKMPAFQGDKSVFLPKKTFKDKLTIGKGNDEIDMFYFGPAHTSGDAFVVFKALRVMHAGDAFAGKTVPIVDTMNGGSVIEYGRTLARAAKIKNVDTVINGHTNDPTTFADLKEYAAFNNDFAAWVEAEKKGGKTADQAGDEYKIPEKYKGYQLGAALFGGYKGNIKTGYEELGKR
jgi:glyoxylase-like metal-dependent hydrolase (beta-lactamase superfamily II)